MPKKAAKKKVPMDDGSVANMMPVPEGKQLGILNMYATLLRII
jgi:hypothetical protein